MTRSHSSWELSEGDPITDQLTAMRLLGGGTNYEAYLAFDDITYGAVVVKVVRPELVDDEGTLRGLRREVEILERVDHPVVVRHFRAELDGSRPHVVLEHLEGPRLSSLVRRHGPLQDHQYLPLGIELASASHYFRHLGIVHLDIKPSNIIMGAPARLIDLSVARSLERAHSLAYAVGTDAYMSPEQCDPQRGVQPGYASDIWGIGATIFHAIEGRAPFKGVRKSEVLTERFPQLQEPAPRLAAHVRPDVADMVSRCLSERPEDRPLPHELAEGLEAATTALPKPKLSFKVR